MFSIDLYTFSRKNMKSDKSSGASRGGGGPGADQRGVRHDAAGPRTAEKNGSQILMGLPAQGNPIPVLILTARDAIADRVKALDGGADDLLMKPFDLSVGASTSEALRDWSCESPVVIDPVLLRPPEAKKKARMEGNPVRAWGFTCSSKGGRTNKQQGQSSAYIPVRSVGRRTYRSIYFL